MSEIIDKIVNEGKIYRDPNMAKVAFEMCKTFLDAFEASDKTNQNPMAFIMNSIADFDTHLNEQLDEVLHHPDLLTLEGSWRGLSFLVQNTETSTRLKLRLLNASKDELHADLEKAVDFDQSQLFKKIYEEEFGTFGGAPYSCLVGNYYFGRNAPDMGLLEKLSQVAAAAHAPFIAGADPSMFDMDSYQQISVPRDMSKLFENPELIKWNSFRESEDSRYVALTLPRVLIRLPYGRDTDPVKDLNYEERVDGAQNDKFCWTNPAFVLGQRIANAFATYGWTVAIRGVEGGGIVEGLPAYTFKTTDGDIALKCPTEVAITDRREKELSDLGFIALCHCKKTDYAAFFGGQTTQKFKQYNLDAANANASLSARLPYVLAASRFAHYIKSIMRDKIGSFMARSNVEQYLNNWLADYILLNDEAGQNVKARYPLREGRVDVFDVPGKPGFYRAVVFLRPHYQMEELKASIRLVAELPPPAA